jgi:hypothetical protein
MKNWRCDNPSAFGDGVDGPNQHISTSGMVKGTPERFSLYGSNDLRAKIEPLSCWQYKPGDYLGIRPLDWDEIIT